MSFINNNQTGKVIQFNHGRGFGIMKHNGRKIIFHIKNYSDVALPKGRRKNSIKFGLKIYCQRPPEVGDCIFFKERLRKDRTTGKQRPCATAWYYREDVTKKIVSAKQNKQLGRNNHSKKGRTTKYHNVPQLCNIQIL